MVKKLIISMFIVLLAVLCVTSVIDRQMTPFDAKGQENLNKNLKNASYTFLTFRLMNASISLLQGTRIHLQPAGIGVTIAIGEALDAVNDLIEQCSWVMLVSVTSLGIQRILMEIGTAWGLKYILPIGLLFILTGLWITALERFRLVSTGFKIVVAAIIIRFLFQGVAVVCSQLDERFMEKYYTEAMLQLETVKKDIDEINILTEEITEESENGVDTKGWLSRQWERTKDFVNLTAKIEGLNTKFEEVKEKLLKLPDYLIDLATIFILQTILIPIAMLWFLKKLLSYFLDATTAQAIDRKVSGAMKGLHQKLDMRQYTEKSRSGAD